MRTNMGTHQGDCSFPTGPSLRFSGGPRSGLTPWSLVSFLSILFLRNEMTFLDTGEARVFRVEFSAERDKMA